MNSAELDTEVEQEDTPISVDGRQLTTAETAECQCPEFCERDHDVD